MMIGMLSVTFATAGDKGEQEEWMKEALKKERSRAEESREMHADTDRFQEKYGWAKEKHPDQFAAMMAAHKKTAEAWSALRSKAEGATHPDSIAESKQIASAASGEAYLAEMALKYVGAAAERSQMIEKSGNSRDVRALAEKLNANEKALYLANRAKHEAQVTAEKLQNENRALGKELRSVYDKEKEKNRGKESRIADRNKEPERDKNKEREKEKDKDRDKEKEEHRNGGDFNPLGS